MSYKLNTVFYHRRGELELYYSNIPVFLMKWFSGLCNHQKIKDYATTKK